MRSRISDKNVFPEFDMDTEYRKLHTLLFDKKAFGRPNGISSIMPCYSYDNCLQKLFLEWPLRGSFTSIEEMLMSLKIGEDHFDDEVTEERLLDYVQFVLNAVTFINHKCKDGDNGIYLTDDSIGKAIVQNCYLILDELNADTDFDGKEIFVVYKDDLADAISLEHRDIEPSIIDYLKIDNRGDIEQKRSILRSLATRLEAEERTLLGTEFKSLCEDTTFLLNKFAKHYMDPKDRTAEKIRQMDDDEIEAWCDKAFHMFLACMSAVPYVEMKKEIKEFKA